MKNNTNYKITAISLDNLDKVTGGTVNDNYAPGGYDSGIDCIINGDNYDEIAQIIADIINGDDVRTRDVDSDVDIYDFII